MGPSEAGGLKLDLPAETRIFTPGVDFAQTLESVSRYVGHETQEYGADSRDVLPKLSSS